MHKNKIVFTLLGILFIFVLSGCFSYRFEVQHNPDGSGLLTIETVFTEDYLGMFDEALSMEEAREEILADAAFTSDELPDDPNIGSVEETDFIDETTGELHHIIVIEIFDVLTTVYFEEGDDTSNLFEIEDQGDGTFLFTANLESLSEFAEDEDEDDFMDPEMFRFFLQGSTISWELHVAQFIEGDAQADYDPDTNIVTWEIPMYDALFAEEPMDLFAVYRVDAAEPVEPEEPIEPEEPAEPVEPEEPAEPIEPEPEDEMMPTPDIEPEETDIEPPVETEIEEPENGLFGLPRWALIVAVAVLCLGGILVVAAVVVIIIVARKRKQNQP